MYRGCYKKKTFKSAFGPAIAVGKSVGTCCSTITIVGLPETEVKEARDRVRSALLNSGFEFPNRRITVNLAPADLPKESGRFDLPIALGILAASEQIPLAGMAEFEFAGELSLSGELRPVRGALAMAYAICREGGQAAFVLPESSAREAAMVVGASVYPARTLLEVAAHFVGGDQTLSPLVAEPMPQTGELPDLADVKGQAQARRALEVAAAGGHSLFMAYTSRPIVAIEN